MNFYHRPDKAKGRGASFSSLFHFVFLSLLTAAFAFTSAQAQTVAYVTSPDTNTISAINTETNTVIASIPLQTPPYAIVASPDGTRIYATDVTFGEHSTTFIPGSIYVIDTATNSLVRTITLPDGELLTSLAITPDGKTLYGTNVLMSDVLAVDIASGNVIATLPGVATNAILMAPNGATVYASFCSPFSNTITAIRTANNTVSATIPFGDSDYPGLGQMAITPDGALLFIPLHGPDSVAVVATATNSIVGQPILVGVSPTAVGITPNGAFAYVANTGGNSVSVIHLASLGVIATIPTSNYGPVSVAFTPDSSFAYVADQNGTVDVISTATNQIVASIPLASPGSIAMVKIPPLPTAVAGPNQTITAGQTVHLDGSSSFAPDTPSAQLQYSWSFVSRPAGSAAALTGANTATASFVADAPGDFAVQLVVTDPATNLASQPSQVKISSIWSPPTANAGPSQSVTTGTYVLLNGLGSTDPNGLPLTYDWSFQAKPGGSAATILGSGGVASFVADVAGIYIVQLVVNDGFGSSAPAITTITATTSQTAEQALQNAINLIGAMPASSFSAAGHQTVLTNQLQQVINDIQKDKITQAIGKLTDAITRTDGFTRGGVEVNGPGMDWVTSMVDQFSLYQALTQALNQLKSM